MVEAASVTLAGLFVFGTFWFWMFVLAAVLMIAAEVYFDKGTPATITLVGTVVFLHFFSGINILQFIYYNIGWFIGGAVLYLLFGALVGLPLKLWLHTKNLSDKYKRAQIDFLRNHMLPDDADFSQLEPKLRKEWQETLDYNLFDIDPRDGSVTFDLHKRQRTAFMWMGHWPFVLLEILLNEPVKRAINFLYERMAVFYRKIIAGNLGHTKGHVLTHKEEAVLKATSEKSDY